MLSDATDRPDIEANIEEEDDTDVLFPEFCEEDDYHLSNVHYNKMLTEDDIWSVFVDHYDFDTFI